MDIEWSKQLDGEIASENSKWEYTGELRQPRKNEYFAVIKASDSTIVFKQLKTGGPNKGLARFILRRKDENDWLYEKPKSKKVLS